MIFFRGSKSFFFLEIFLKFDDHIFKIKTCSFLECLTISYHQNGAFFIKF